MRKLNTPRPARIAMLIAGIALSTLLSAQAGAAVGHFPRHGWMAPGTGKVASLIYVSDAVSSVVDVYTNDAQPHRIGQITNGLSYPSGMSVDATGNLYVANLEGHDVTVYHQGATSPFLTISQGLKGPNSVAIGNDGSVYVADFFGGIVGFRAGAQRPFYRVPPLPGSSGDYTDPADLGIDASGILYVYYQVNESATGAGFAAKYAPPSKTGTQLGFINTTNANGIDLDHSGNISIGWEASTRGNGGIAVFMPSGQKINRWGFLQGISSLRLGANEKQLYATNAADNTVVIYSYPNGHLIRRIRTGIGSGNPLRVAVSPGHSH